MATASQPPEQHARIVTAIHQELDRQAHESGNRIDVEAMARAIDAVLAQSAPPAEGQRPQDLNATNDG